jgi:hypothetical protein
VNGNVLRAPASRFVLCVRRIPQSLADRSRGPYGRVVNAPSAVVVAHLVATLFMVGLIWFVQVVHYPLMAGVGREHFVAYEERHRNRTAVVVGPPMAVEGVCTLWLFIAPPHGMGRAVPFIGGVLLAVVLASTVWLQVPMHERLSRGFDTDASRRLVVTNWVRTLGWSARGVLAALMMAVSV